MLHRRNVFDTCQQLAHHGHLLRYEVGDTVARGFADIGYEEFTLLPNNKLVSRLTGQTSEVSERDQGHLFLVPTPDQILALIDATDTRVTSATNPDNRNWVVACQRGGEQVSISKSSLHVALLGALAYAVGVDVSIDTRLRLKTELSRLCTDQC